MSSHPPALHAVTDEWVRDHFLTAADVAAIFGVPLDTVFGWVHAGRLPGMSLSPGEQRFRPHDVLTLLAALVREPGGRRGTPVTVLYGDDMTDNASSEPTVDDVMVPTEPVHPDHREHAKQGKHVDQDELDARARHEEPEVHGH